MKISRMNAFMKYSEDKFARSVLLALRAYHHDLNEWAPFEGGK